MNDYVIPPQNECAYLASATTSASVTFVSWENKPGNHSPRTRILGLQANCFESTQTFVQSPPNHSDTAYTSSPSLMKPQDMFGFTLSRTNPPQLFSRSSENGSR